MMMSERKIRLSQMKEVKEFVSVAGKCDFEMYITTVLRSMQNLSWEF